MGFNFGGLGNIREAINQLKEGGMGGLLQNLPLDQLLEKLPLDQLPLDQLMDKLPLDQLLSSSFLQEFTPFASLTELLQNGGFPVTSAEDLKSLPSEQLNEHVSRTTSFGSFKDMLLKAAEFYTQRK